MENLQTYLFPILLLAFFTWRFTRFKKIKAQLPKLLAEGAIVVDVRSPGEFSQGSRPGSINIPLGDILSRSKELDQNKPIILCCASGARSGAAVGILMRQGFKNVVNAGSWTNTIS